MTERPDKHIEEFWLGFKKSMYNFYKDKKIVRPINIWSENLNMLKDLKDYNNIEKKIRDYISLYAIDIIRCKEIRYFKIMLTNIKRWNKISEKFSLNNIDNNYYNIIFLIIDIYKTIIVSNSHNNLEDIDNIQVKTLFDDVELLIINKDFTKIIKYSIDNNKSSILDKINKYFDIKIIIKEIYDIDKLPNKISSKKLITLIKKLID